MPVTVAATYKETLKNFVRLTVLYPTETTESASTLGAQNRQSHFGKMDKEMSGNEVGKSSMLVNSYFSCVSIEIPQKNRKSPAGLTEGDFQSQMSAVD